ncbi:MAG: carbon-nitrogen hydrolase family protein [Candidatus Humimicrobiaceae bacterium]
MNIKCAICQLKISDKKEENLAKAEKMIRKAAKKNIDIAILPEIFNSPYNTNFFKQYSETYPAITTDMLSSVSKELGIYIIGGSICEKEDDSYYNTSYSFDRCGKLIGKHRKIHLFDIDIKGKINFKESDILSCGNKSTVFNTEFCKIGVLICYDMRFPELAKKMVKEGAKIIISPASFNMTTGPAHWEILIRTRAIDNQVYFLAASPARDIKSNYVSFGHSIMVNPWGEIIAEAGEKECILYGNLELGLIEKIREELPLLKHARYDLY